MALSEGKLRWSQCAFGPDGVLHVIYSDDYGSGDGLRYTHNVLGFWSPIQTVLSTFPKVPGISADPFGNVAVTLSNVIQNQTKTEVYVYSIAPITPRYFYSPSSVSLTIQTKGVRRVPEVTYNLAWTANNQNNDAFLQGYAIYMKEGTGAYQPLLTLDKTTFTAAIKFTDLSKKRRFAVATVALGGGESELVEF